MAIRVVVADDALARLFSTERDVEVVVQHCASGEEVLAVMRREQPDALFLDARLVAQLGCVPPPNGDAKQVLTRRELDIVRMVAVGARNKKIAEQLGIAEGTVKMHLHTIYEKLEISGRVELSIYAREHAIV